MRGITLDHLQSIIDQDEAAGLSKSSINNDKMLMKALFHFAMERDIVAKDYSKFVQLPGVEAKYEKGAFNDVQIKKLEGMAAAGFPWADTVLILCYTGFRISEFLELTRFSYHADGDYLQGGKKTEAGKNRIVPVHPRIKPYLIRWLAKEGETIICDEKGNGISVQRYRSRFFQPIAEALGAPQATPHWCRHTFATRGRISGMDSLAIKRIMGHADLNITEHYTHDDVQWLAEQLKKVS